MKIYVWNWTLSVACFFTANPKTEIPDKKYYNIMNQISRQKNSRQTKKKQR